MVRTLPLLALLALPLAAQGPSFPPPPAGPGHRGPEHALRALGLSPEQDRAVKAVLDKGREAERSLLKALMEREEALQAALQDLAAPEAQIKALHGAASDARYQLLLAHRSRQREVFACLSAEQKAKLKRLQEKMAKEREARRALAEEMPPPPPLG